MDILDWIVANCPGEMREAEGAVTIKHPNNDTTSLWLRDSAHPIPAELLRLSEVYGRFDGMDLFSSTFKIASLKGKHLLDGVPITPSLADFQQEVVDGGMSFPEPCVPFMLQAGGWFYGFAPASGAIYEWDSETSELTEKFETVTAVLAQWLRAVKE